MGWIVTMRMMGGDGRGVAPRVARLERRHFGNTVGESTGGLVPDTSREMAPAIRVAATEKRDKWSMLRDAQNYGWDPKTLTTYVNKGFFRHFLRQNGERYTMAEEWLRNCRSRVRGGRHPGEGRSAHRRVAHEAMSAWRSHRTAAGSRGICQSAFGCT